MAVHVNALSACAKSMSFSDSAIGTIPRNYYRIHSWDMTKSEVVNRMKLLI